MTRTIRRNGHELYIRPLRGTDTDRLFSLIVGLSPESRRLFRPHAFTREDALRVTHEPPNGRSTRLVIVEPSEDLVVAYGYFSEAGVGDTRYPLLGITVADRYQNQGLGTLLMETLIEEARAQGKVGLQLTVYKQNARAIHVYEKLGFRVIGDADGGKQHAMRLQFAPNSAVYDLRGVLLHPVPWGRSRLTLDTWSAPQWMTYLDFLHLAGANLLKVYLWPAHYYHPDVPETLPNSWRYGVLRQALEHARSLGMRTYVGFALNGVPPSVWHAHKEMRAAELGYHGVGLCWSRGQQEITRFPAFLMDALHDCTDGFVPWVAGPAFCACPDCHDYARVVCSAVEEYTRLLDGRAALHVNLCSLENLHKRVGPRLCSSIIPALSAERFAVVSHDDHQVHTRLGQKGIPLLVLDTNMDASGAQEAEALLPRPRLRQVDRLVAQNSDTAGVLGPRAMPATQFPTDFVLLQRLLFPGRANHEVLRDLGSRLFSETTHAFSLARALWALDSWWETGRRIDLSDACDGLRSLPEDGRGFIRPLRDAVELLRELERYLGEGERQFDALVTRVHSRLAESPAFQGYTIDQVWQTRARTAVVHHVTDWLDMLRKHLVNTAP